jgi:hypothetical protein
MAHSLRPYRRSSSVEANHCLRSAVCSQNGGQVVLHHGIGSSGTRSKEPSFRRMRGERPVTYQVWLSGLLVSLSMLLCAVMNAEAACGGSSPNRVAASPAWADVRDCVTAAASGDTISVPAGSATWSSTIDVAKNVAIVGAGASNTRVTMNGACFELDNAFTIRISGFGFTNCHISVSGEPGAGTTHRVDHNSFTSASPWIVHEIFGGCPTARHSTGLWDNNSFRNYAVHVNGSQCSLGDGNTQHQLWAQPPPLGDGTGVVYIEDNTFTGDIGTQNYVDGNYAARFVFRFNTSNADSVGSTEIHSVQGANRAVQLWEIYKNSFTKTNSSWYPLAYVRGGSGVIWGNRLSANYTSDILINNVRSCRDPGDGVGKCSGGSNWDQNTGGLDGYACRDQIGRSRDSSVWAPGGAYAQILNPAYFWDNIKGTSTPVAVNVDAGESCPGPGGDLNASHLAANRDWYTRNSSFNGTTGVGQGPLSNRPATCTPGVAYWATDQGEWNSRQPGPDGRLYRCTTSNTWSIYYTPYTYPHPLQQGGALPAPGVPAAPSGLNVTP